MIDPAVDRFILKCAKEEKVEMKQFDLSDELRSFTAQTKQVSSKEDTNFKKLFHEIKSAEEITILRNAIKYLKGKQYSSKSAEMKALIDGQTSKLIASFLGYCGLKHSERYRTHCRRKPIPKSNAYAYSTVLTG